MRASTTASIRSAPFNEVDATPSQLRWSPFPIPQKPTDFVDGIVTLGGNGDVAHPGRHGGAHLCRQPLDDRPLLLQCRRRDADRAAAGPRALRHRARRDRSGAAARSRSSRAAALRSSCRTARRAATSARTTAPMLRLPELGPARLQRPRQSARLSQPRSPPTRTRRRPCSPGREIPGQSVGGRDGRTRRSTWSRGTATSRPTNTTWRASWRSARSASIIPIRRSSPC